MKKTALIPFFVSNCINLAILKTKNQTGLVKCSNNINIPVSPKNKINKNLMHLCWGKVAGIPFIIIKANIQIFCVISIHQSKVLLDWQATEQSAQICCRWLCGEGSLRLCSPHAGQWSMTKTFKGKKKINKTLSP